MYKVIVALCLLVAVVAGTPCSPSYVCHAEGEGRQCFEFNAADLSIGVPCESPSNPIRIDSLTYLDKSQMRSVLTNAWQKNLNTGADPANGKWFEHGANGDNIGLYGGLTDTINPTIVFDDAHKTFTSADLGVMYSDADNRNGLNPSQNVQLQFQHSFEQSQSHTVAHQFTTGIGIDFQAKAEIFGIGGDVTTKFSFDYSYSFSDTTSSSTTDTTTYTTSVALTVPKGEVYRAVLQASKQQMTVPTYAYTYVSGETETWFESRVNGHYDWVASAGAMWNWIRMYGSAGSDSQYYSMASNGDGQIVVPGSISGQNYVHMCTYVVRIPDALWEKITLSDEYKIQSNC